MILRLSSSIFRGALIVGAFLIFVAMSYSSIRNARASHYAGLQTLQGFERATQLEPGNPRNWYLLGRYWQYNLEEPDPGRAIQAYNKALQFDPRSAATWTDLGNAYESEGNLEAARAAFLEARKVYPASAEVAWRYGNFLLRTGDVDLALAEMRHAVAGDPRLGAEAFSRCMRVEPDIGKIIDKVLPQRADVYLAVIADLSEAGDSDNALKVWDRLTTFRAPINMRATFPLIDALMKSKRFSEARQVWDQAALRAGLTLTDPAGSAVWDGGFESGVSGGGFSWMFPPVARGAQIAIDAAEKHSGNYSLRAIFDGRYNLDFSSVCQNAVVKPSASYRFSAWLRTRGMQTDQGLRFRLTSQGAVNHSAVLTTDVHGNQDWTRVELPWDATSDVNLVEICAVRLPGAVGDGKISGTAWIDDVALVPASGKDNSR
jgi:tetratricopeptide (TPR) repeat protein